MREPKDLVIIEAADHLFNGKTSSLAKPLKVCSAITRALARSQDNEGLEHSHA